MNGDKLATVAGMVIAAGTAATPIFNAVGEGSLHQGDYINLVIAVVMSIFGIGSKIKLKGE